MKPTITFTLVNIKGKTPHYVASNDGKYWAMPDESLDKFKARIATKVINDFSRCKIVFE